MAQKYDQLNDKLKTFIREQKIFFIASAAEEGRVNLSPKGYNTLKILDDNRVLYLDYPGSGNETARHTNDGGRLTVMFASFDDKPMILRLYGKGEVIPEASAKFDEFFSLFQNHNRQAVRQMILITVEEVEISCGFGVPLFEYKGEREELRRCAEKEAAKGPLSKCFDKIKGTLK